MRRTACFESADGLFSDRHTAGRRRGQYGSAGNRQRDGNRSGKERADWLFGQ